VEREQARRRSVAVGGGNLLVDVGRGRAHRRRPARLGRARPPARHRRRHRGAGLDGDRRRLRGRLRRRGERRRRRRGKREWRPRRERQRARQRGRGREEAAARLARDPPLCPLLLLLVGPLLSPVLLSLFRRRLSPRRGPASHAGAEKGGLRPRPRRALRREQGRRGGGRGGLRRRELPAAASAAAAAAAAAARGGGSARAASSFVAAPPAAAGPGVGEAAARLLFDQAARCRVEMEVREREKILTRRGRKTPSLFPHFPLCFFSSFLSFAAVVLPHTLSRIRMVFRRRFRAKEEREGDL